MCTTWSTLDTAVLRWVAYALDIWREILLLLAHEKHPCKAARANESAGYQGGGRSPPEVILGSEQTVIGLQSMNAAEGGQQQSVLRIILPYITDTETILRKSKRS